MKRIFFVGLMFLGFLLSACQSITQDAQPLALKSEVILQSVQTVGQTFTAWDRGLTGIDVFLAPDTTDTGEIRLHLSNIGQTADIAVGTIETQFVSVPGFYRFSFAPQSDSRGHDYFIWLDISGNAKVRIGTANGDSYLDGALYQNNIPGDQQLAFRLAYDPVELILGLVSLAKTWLQVLVVAILLFVLPGWALLGWGLPSWKELSWGERLGLSAGLSVALYPLLLLWTAIFDLHLGSLYAWVPMLAALAAILWRNRTWRPNAVSRAWRTWQKSGWVLPDMVFFVLIGLIVFTRFWVIRSLDVPLWGDSYQHTMIAQLIVDHGGLFDSWQPYADLQSFTYHYGFHSAVAVFHWITGTAMPRATLWVGQILNVLAILVLYPLALWVGKNRWAGVGAVLIAGLLAQMPMFYVNWGRYTQLTGQVVLPGVILVAWMILESSWRNWRLITLSWLLWGGLALSHYRVLIFALCFLIAFFFLKLVQRQFIDYLIKIFWMGLGGACLFLPWFIHTFAGKITSQFAVQLSTPAESVSAFINEYNSLGDLANYLPMVLWLLFFLSLVWGLWRREKTVAVLGLWCFFLLLAANPQWLRLPGEGALSNFAVFIAAYIPVSVMLGSMLGGRINNSTFSTIKPKWANRTLKSLAIFVFVVLALEGTQSRLTDIAPQNSLVTRPDLRAAKWIGNNTSKDARILVNSFFAYGNTVVVGSDGGWWLPLLANRPINVPPINYTSEIAARPDYKTWINTMTKRIQNEGITSSSIMTLLHEQGISYVYIGQRQGRVNYGGPFIFQPEQLLSDLHFRAIYHQDLIWVFEIEN